MSTAKLPFTDKKRQRQFRKKFPAPMPMNPIPPDWGERFCTFEGCFETATRTICQDPEHCGEGWCRECIGCDEHAHHIGVMVWLLLAGKLGEPTTEPESEAYGGHD